MSEEPTLEILLKDESYIRWIRGEATEKEQKKWITWLQEHPGHKNLTAQAEHLMQLTGPDELTIPDTEAELERFETILDRITSSEEGDRNKYFNNRRSSPFYGAVAAGLLLLIMVISLFLFLQPPDRSTDEISENTVAETINELQTNYGEKIHLKLGDGSTIVLNANSHLKYSSSAGKGYGTHVWLEGEAYFDITHNKNQRVFIVHTSDGMVKVLGTKFTVKTTLEETTTVLQEGQIRLQVKNDGTVATTKRTEVVMKPGELARYSSGDGKIDIAKVNPIVYTSWIQNRWVFDQTSLKEITERMEDTYGVEVKIQQKKLFERILSGSIKSTNLKILKEALSKLLHVPVTQTGNTIIIG